MSKIVAVNFNQKSDNKRLETFKKYSEQAYEINIGRIYCGIEIRSNHQTVQDVLDIFVDHIIGSTYEDLSAEKTISDIKNGYFNQLRDILMNRLKSDTIINYLFEEEKGVHPDLEEMRAELRIHENEASKSFMAQFNQPGDVAYV